MHGPDHGPDHSRAGVVPKEQPLPRSHRSLRRAATTPGTFEFTLERGIHDPVPKRLDEGYGEFADRNALVERVLDTWEQAVVDDVISRIENTDDDPRTKLRHLFELARDRSGAVRRALAVELAIRDWARRSPGVSERLRRVDDRRMAYLRTLFRQISTDENDAEARSFLVLSLFVGNSLITAEHDGRSRREVIDHALESMLSPSRQPHLP
jgi:hypothetical protein